MPIISAPADSVRRSHRWVPFLMAAAGVVGLTAAPLAACDPIWLPSIRLRATATLVVRFSEDTVADVARPVFAPTRADAFERHRDLARRGPFGLRATITAVDARSAWRPVSGTAAVLVPWEFSSDCEPFPFSQSARWARPAVPSVVTAWLRPRSGWIGGVATLDVEMAGIEPRWTDQDSRWPHDRTNLMSALEYLALTEVLPTPADLERRPRETARRIDAWAARHPALAAKEPGLTILANLRRQLKAK